MLPFYALVPLNMYGQYWLATHVPSGYPLPQSEKEERFLGNDPSSWLAPEQWGFKRTRGTAVSGNAFGGRRRVRRCRKCNGPKPPVSYFAELEAGANGSAPTTAQYASAACSLWITTVLVSLSIGS